ncbi:MAG: hypothetical protein K2N56_02695 [Oscillospiraceae bacterium]|nr:hypothetical protein [Oscillospiraceae bacterium]
MKNVGAKAGTVMSGIAKIFAVVCIGVLFILFGTVCFIVIGNVNGDRQALQHTKEDFSSVLADFDGLFTVRNANDNDSRGKRTVYFGYNGDQESFVSDCIDFCNAAPVDYDNTHPFYEMVFLCGRKLRIKVDTTNRIFFSNVYMEDYSCIEKFKWKYRLVMGLSDFTPEQQEHLRSIRNDYSFEIELQ